jgi:predicted cupin superfamily sugar epimerase
MKKAEEWIKKLELILHPEGGYYKQIYSSKLQIERMKDNGSDNWKRSLSTSIYFLLRSGDVSKFHKLKSDELWYFHTGSSLTLYTMDEEGK